MEPPGCIGAILTTICCSVDAPIFSSRFVNSTVEPAIETDEIRAFGLIRKVIVEAGRDETFVAETVVLTDT
ncbi:hypothetical protein OFB47_32735, partial [Escherichia coli]|nr:hypothetical protein [Escherichia coli]MCV4872568.1 hypothetical protein [Escherichia coli]